MENWDEVRTAYQVARKGTVSGAADVLGVHHATVIRHIDALEDRLGVKLFQRHPRGYTPTEAGMDLLQVAQATDDQFAQLAGRIRGQGEGVSGELVITSLPIFADLVAPVLAELQAAHPGLQIRYLTGERLFRLEYGEAHIAVRSGPAPGQPDNVVQTFAHMSVQLVAAPAYIARYGMPANAEDLTDHVFVGVDETASRAPFNDWIAGLGHADKIRFRADATAAMHAAIAGGAGLGFVPTVKAEEMGLVTVLPAQAAWQLQTWLVTHVDLHRSNKVQTVLKALKEAAVAGDWGR